MSELDIQTVRHLKIGRHKDLLSIYKTQLNQLVTLIKEREASIERIQLAMDKEDMVRARAFNIKVSRAKDDALSCPLEVGQRYRSGPEFFDIKPLPNGLIGVVRESDGMIVVGGKLLETLSEVFFFDFPAAVLVK